MYNVLKESQQFKVNFYLHQLTLNGLVFFWMENNIYVDHTGKLATTSVRMSWALLGNKQKKIYDIPGNATISFLISSPTVDSKVDAFLSFAIMVGTARIMIFQFGQWKWALYTKTTPLPPSPKKKKKSQINC